MLSTPWAVAATPVNGALDHGPFQIQAGIRSVSSGTFPNQGGNPFARRKVSEFEVRWKGQPVTVNGNRTFWRVLRLPAAPRPALLLVTQVFVLATEEAGGTLRLQPVRSESASLAEVQWLDERDGQPGAARSFGIEAVTDLQSGTLLQGGRWLRFGSRSVMDVASLKVFPVEPWVPVAPGQPDTHLSREGDDVRAFSPGRRNYVLAASGIDYGSADGRQAHGLLVVDIERGTASEIRVDRKRMRFAEPDDIDSAWVHHHFSWVRNAAGQEVLQARNDFRPWSWRARLRETRPGVWQMDVPRIDEKFVQLVKSVLAAKLGAKVIDADQPWGAGATATLADCTLQVRAFGKESLDPGDSRVSVWPEETRTSAAPASCEAALRRLATSIDGELASGRHDALLRLD